ncbi:Metallo-hydrolase/oxidoreductase [Mycena amicta]|nr:Metallo-hydrolase/oxidoreductase [Mycena amicta]
MLTTPSAAFRTQRLTESTFLISEYNDIYDEHPQIFAKRIVSARTILVIDTGCGGASVDPDVEITSLRKYLEQVPLECNNNEPLNKAGSMEYVVVGTHCHYDHILGMEQFTDGRILVSSHSPTFISPSNPTYPQTPNYTPILVPDRYEINSSTHLPLGIFILHTPGHTPDQLAVYDTVERMLYVGDTLYEEETIIFPKEGSILQWMSSMDSLLALVKAVGRDVQINCGHRTSCRPAEEVLQSTKDFMEDVLAGREPVRRREWRRYEENVVYLQDGGRFALRCPERLVLEARKHKDRV